MQFNRKIIQIIIQELYKDPSPIEDFYPPTFETDLNGKKQEWEAVVLIPFIDEVGVHDYKIIKSTIYIYMSET